MGSEGLEKDTQDHQDDKVASGFITRSDFQNSRTVKVPPVPHEKQPSPSLFSLSCFPAP